MSLRAFISRNPFLTSPPREVEGVYQIEAYEFYDIDTGQTTQSRVLLFEVSSEKHHKPHAVLLALHPRKKEWVIWCVSTKRDLERLEKATGKEDFYSHNCPFWKRETCPHVETVFYYLRNKVDITTLEEWEAWLKEALPERSSASSAGLLFLLKEGRNTLIFGETGGGKTYSILEAFRDLKGQGVYDELIQIDFSSGLEDTDLLSKTVPMTPERKIRKLAELRQRFPEMPSEELVSLIGDWDMEEGELTRAFRQAQEGKRVLVLLEEITRATPRALNVLVKAMDPVSGKYRLWNFLTGKVYEVDTDRLTFVATANMGSSYSGTDRLDEALMDRFHAVLYKGYDRTTEERILRSLGLDEEIVVKMLKTARLLREYYKNAYLPKPFSTRMLKNWGEMIARGMDPLQAFNMTKARLVDVNEFGQPDEVQLQHIDSVLDKVWR